MEQKIRYIALHSKVLVVAKEGIVKDWSAYCAPVPGECHEDEYMGVFGTGSKLPYNVAKVLFPDFDEEFEWRQ